MNGYETQEKTEQIVLKGIEINIIQILFGHFKMLVITSVIIQNIHTFIMSSPVRTVRPLLNLCVSPQALNSWRILKLQYDVYSIELFETYACMYERMYVCVYVCMYTRMKQAGY